MIQLHQVSIASLFFLYFAAFSLAEDPVQLRYRFEAGQVVRYAVSMRDDYEIQVAEASDTPFTEQSSIKQYRVVSVNPDGSAVLELMLESVQLTIQSDGKTENFDSTAASAKAGPAFAPLLDIIGKPHLRVTAAINGQLTNVESLLGNGAQPNEISKSALDAFITLPGEPIAVGTTWREDFSVPIQVTDKLAKSIKMQRRFYLHSVENGRATITFETKILSPINDADDELQLLRRPTKGTIVLDLQRGLLLEKTVTLDNTVSGFGGVASAMKLTQRHSEKILEPQTAAASTSSPN